MNNVKHQVQTLIAQDELKAALSSMLGMPAYRYIAAVLRNELHTLDQKLAAGELAREEYALAVVNIRQDALAALEGVVLPSRTAATSTELELDHLMQQVVADDLWNYYPNEANRNAIQRLDEPIPLDFKVTYGEVASRWTGDPSALQFRVDTDIETLYARLEGHLLLLGPAGAGKSYLLREIALHLVQRRQEDPHQPVPIILDLSGWNSPEREFEEWIVAQINNTYIIRGRSQEIISTWLDDARLVLLLDGLDAVAEELREVCVERINQLRNTKTPPGLVVTSRPSAYTTLSTPLQVRTAVHLQPLDRRVIVDYLRTNVVDSPELVAAIASDDGLVELAQTPLVASMLSVTLRSSTYAELASISTAPVDERRRLLYNAFVKAVFTLHAGSGRFTRDQTLHWLVWLAGAMRYRNLPVLRFEHIQPGWMVRRWERWIYFLVSRTAVGLVAGLLAGPVIALGLELTLYNVVRGVIEGLSGGVMGGLAIGVLSALWLQRPASRAQSRLAQLQASLVRIGMMALVALPAVYAFFILVLSRVDWCMLFPAGKGLCINLSWTEESISVALVVALSFSLVFGVEQSSGPRSGPRTVEYDIQAASLERLRLRWSSTRSLIFIIVAACLGALGGAALDLSHVDRRSSNFIVRFVDDVVRALDLPSTYTTLGVAALGFLFLGLAATLVTGLTGSAIQDDRRTGPNQAIVVAWRNSRLMGSAAIFGFLVIGGIVGGSSALIGIRMAGQYAATFAIYGAFIGFLVFLWFGGLDSFLHVCLRLLLWMRGYTPEPRQYQDFLVYSSELQFLRPIHGGYQFRHPTWQRFLAEQVAL